MGRPGVASIVCVAVTGGRGFIGRHLSRELSRLGMPIRVLDLATPSEAPFPFGLIGLTGVEVIRADVCDRQVLGPALQGVRVVVHLAGLASVARSREDPLGAFRLNTLGTVNVLDAAREAGVRRVVLASSMRVTEGSADAYALTKAMAEQCVQLYATEFLGGAVVVRLANVYGPGQEAGVVVSDFFEKATSGRAIYEGDPTESVPLVYVEDVAEALAILVKAEEVREVVTVRGREEVSLGDLARFVAALGSGKEAPVPTRAWSAGPIASPDVGLARLGWEPRIRWTEGVRRAWTAWRSRPLADALRPA